VKYSGPIKTARMDAVSKAISGGALVLQTELGDAVMFPLDTPSGLSAGGLLVLRGFPRSEIVVQAGRLSKAKIINRFGEDSVIDITVGKENSDVVADVVDVAKGDAVKILSAELRNA